MLGPVSGVVSAARRRSRRRRRLFLLIVVLLAVVIGELVHQIVNSNSPATRRSVGSWVADVAPIITDANTLNGALDYVEHNGSTLSRPELTQSTTFLLSSASIQSTKLRSNPLGAPTGISRARLLTALEDRSRAFSLFGSGVHLAISGGALSQADADFASALSQMRSAQESYRTFRSSLPRGADPSQLPPVHWIGPPDLWSTSTLDAFASQLAKAPQLRPRHLLVVVALSVNPPPEVIPTTTTTTTVPRRATRTTTTTLPKRSSGTTKSGKSRATRPSTTTTTTTTSTTLPPVSQIPSGRVPSVFAPTGTIQPIVVVRNEGNVDETGVSVFVSLGGETVQSGLISLLRAGDARYLRLGQLGVKTASMSACTGSSLRHDRCTNLVVRLDANGRLRSERSVAVAFFVS